MRRSGPVAGVIVRPMRAGDAVLHRDFLARVDSGDLRLRFGRDLADVPHSELARLRAVDRAREIVFVATIPRAGGGCEIAGEVRARADPAPYGARSEFAIVVRSDLQRLGLGRLLLERLIAECRPRKVQQLYGLVAASNAGMLALARRTGFDIDHVPGGGTVVVSLDLGSAVPKSTRGGRLDERAGRAAGRVQLAPRRALRRQGPVTRYLATGRES